MAFLIGTLLTLACVLIVSYPLIKTRFTTTYSLSKDQIYELTHLRQLMVSEIAQLETQPNSGETDPAHNKIVMDKLKADLERNLTQEYSILRKLDHIELDKTLPLEAAIEKKVQELSVLIKAGYPNSIFCISCVSELKSGTVTCPICGNPTIHTDRSKRRLRQ
jgi:hypothetical protein